ncbi:hypothetical protein BS50DRAFT_164385 [Corynespora cassiicola Philippines]|uniref:Uncharacterized protein n=1 Tax=Corynespora cassiicola Philippines TaxID=1448308 RepID=A0A2T2N6N4_CORCC|nr:hypothetical protein BS50DRAFT_164385 [Corynespora cassiicola Philippines]
MGRHRGPKFSFPIPGRRPHTKVDPDAHEGPHPTSSIPSASEWSPRVNEPSPSSYSKAERLLGTAGLPFRPSSRQASLPPPSPGYMTITVSEASFGSEPDDKASSTVVEDTNLYPTKRPSMIHRASSNILGYAYSADGRRGSNGSSSSRKLHPANSNSTMRSHYDAEGSPLYISQQTSNSAVRDGALRKGKPQITSVHGYDSHVPSPLAYGTADEAKKQNRKSKPPRLDLSKLFPKPKPAAGPEYAGALLSPNKLVDSPTAMSIASDYFPRPMTREPTPTPKGQAKLTKRQQLPTSQVPRPTSPIRLHKRDMYDNAKINVRRPPQGIQHWFDAIDDESDGQSEEERTPLHAPRPIHPRRPPLAPLRKSSLGRLLQEDMAPHTMQYSYAAESKSSKKEHNIHRRFSGAHMESPSQTSTQSQVSLVSNKTKESAFSRSNLQDSSVLSFSSSEDEDDDHTPEAGKFPVRDSLDISEDHGEIITGQAQAFELRPRNARRPSEGKISLLSTSTNAATIEVMYTPEPFAPTQFPRSYSSSKRSSHVRHPSVILENEHARPHTSTNRPKSPSTSMRSARTSTSEPRIRSEQHKLMAVTAEEEALLEMMRRKRAAMAKQNSSEGHHSAFLHETHEIAPPESNVNKTRRTSAFLTMETPVASPVRLVNTKASRKSFAGSASPLLVPPSRGRPAKADVNAGTSILRDSSSCDTRSDRLAASPSSHISLAHQLSPPPEFSPLDPFPSPARTASIASPTTTDLPSPLPSPVTPGLRHGESDVDVKVASSEPSCNGDNEEMAVLETGVIDPPSGSIKPDESHASGVSAAHHRRRRTASSDADITFPMPKALENHDLTPVSEASSRTPSIIDPPHSLPKLPRKSSRRKTSLTVSTSFPTKSRHSSVASTHASSPVTAPHERRSSRILSRGNSIHSINRESVSIGSASTRCSVSEDVLAAWGSLGGLRDYNTARY